MSDAGPEAETSVGRDGEPRSSIDRAFAVLSTFDESRVRQSLTDLSRQTGLPVATTHRIVQRLLAAGALERERGGKYRIGLRLWEIASLAPRSTGLQRIARPFMQDLYEATGHATHLAIREGTQLVSLQRFQSPRRSRFTSRTGKRYPLHASAVGLVLLAYAPRDVQEEVLGGDLAPYTRHTIVRRAELDRVLQDVRRTGVAVGDRGVNEQDVGVAAPIFSPQGVVIGALALAFPFGTGTAQAMVAPVQLSATSITRAVRELGRMEGPDHQ